MRTRSWITAIAVFGCLMTATAAVAQTEPAVEAAGGAVLDVTADEITELQKSAAENTELSEAEKTQISEVMQRAAADLKTAETAESQARAFDQRMAGLEADRAELEKKNAQPTEAAAVQPGRSISDLESERVELRARITQLEQDLKQPTADPAERAASRKAARDVLAELPTTLNDVKQKLEAPAPEGEPPLLTRARQLALKAQQRAIETRMNAAQKQLALYDAADAVNLPTLRREAYTRELNARRKRLEAIEAEINAQRQAEAERRAMEAELAAMNAEPLLKKILEENQEIARTEQELRVKHEEDKELLRRLETRLTEVKDAKTDAEKLDDDVGLEKGGLWLRKERNNLDDLDALYQEVEERIEHTTDVLFALYEREDQLDGLRDVEAEADRLTEKATAEGTADPDEFRSKAEEVLRSQSVNLDKLIAEYTAYTETLSSLSGRLNELKNVADEYADFLDERILWVRSHLPISLASLISESGSIADALALTSWVAAIKSLGWDAADHLPMYGSVALLLIFLLIRRGRHSQQLQEIAQRAAGRVTVSIAPTMHCLVITLWLSIVWPGLILFFAWRLHESTISSPELQVAALNLARLASTFFLLEFIRQSVRPFGLAEAHFEWNSKTLRRVRRLLWTVILVGIPIAAAVACLHQNDHGSRRDDLERLLFIGSMVVLMGFARGLLHPKRGALRQMKALQDGGWVDRLDYLWYFLGLGIPLILAGFAYAGYYDTAVRLALKVQRTAWLVVAAIYLHALLNRWLRLRHRRLRIEKARERLAAAQDTPKAPESGAPLPDVDQDQADLEESSEQSHRMLTTMIVVASLIGLGFVWADVLPAIRFLDRWPIWETTKQGVEYVKDPETGVSTPQPTIEVQSVTIASLVQVLIIILLTSTAARNIPGLLEMSLLARLPIDRSTAYAITSLTRYGLVLIGLILVSQALGLAWSNVQWLAAALTFGLGFGLQEIFANFVSGLIILFEQPVRVGDVVTIDGVSGVVNRIRIRATTIVDWDRKEYIVPNREFITGRLLNWTLSDKMNRIVVNVGVAYGSNTTQVRSIITEVLDNHPNVLKEPPPLVTFESFGDSSLNFVVRAYLPDLENRLMTIHDLHSDIHRKLAENEIEIPFPQRDLHLRTTVSLDEVQRSSTSTNGHSDSTAKHSEQLTDS